MSGDNIVVDTSLIINLFNGVEGIKSLITDRNLFVFIISEIELLSFPNLSSNDKQLLKDFLSECYIVDIEPSIKELAIEIRSKTKLKLPDAIIAAVAIHYDMPLLTMDRGFKRVDNLDAIILSI
jgi:predicted nucleic acid-binding protein